MENGSFRRVAQSAGAGLSSAEHHGRRSISADQHPAHFARRNRLRILKKLSSILPLASLTLACFSVSGQTVTFNKQIAPIIYNNCSSCHRPGEAAPFSLLSYAGVSKKGKIIASVTAAHFMPPWKAEAGSYAFKDERRLTDSQIALIGDWVKEGMPEGKPNDAPAPPKFASGWMLGEPDLVVEMPTAYHVPADGPDI